MSDENVEEEGLTAPKPLVKGKFSDPEKDFIKKNYRLMTDREIGNALNRDPKSIENQRRALKINDKKSNKINVKKPEGARYRKQYINSLGTTDKHKLVKSELRGSATYKRIKDILDRQELDFYEQKYIAFMTDPSIETMTVPERDALHELTMCQISIMRLYKEEKDARDNHTKFNRSRDVKDLQDTIQKYQRDLNVTRSNRLKNASDSATNFMNLIKEMKQPELRRELGHEAAMLKFIAEKHYNSKLGKNILSGNGEPFDLNDLFLDGKEPDGLGGEFSETNEQE